MTTNYLIKYNLLLEQVKDIINQINNLGENTNQFKEIITTLEQEIKIQQEQILKNHQSYTSNDPFKEAELNMLAQNQINKLNSLKEKLINQYNIYQKLENSIHLLEQNEENINKQNIKEFTEIVKNTLKLLLEDNTLDYEIKTLSKIILDYILLEYLFFKESEILEYLKQDEELTYIINKLVKQTLEELDLTNYHELKKTNRTIKNSRIFFQLFNRRYITSII